MSWLMVEKHKQGRERMQSLHAQVSHLCKLLQRNIPEDCFVASEAVLWFSIEPCASQPSQNPSKRLQLQGPLALGK